MNCQYSGFTAARLVVKVATWIAFGLVALQVAVDTAVAQTSSPTVGEYKALARDFEYQFRAGNLDIVPTYVTVLEEATRAQPEDADLWYLLGRAYLALAARALLAEKPEEAMPAMQKGPAALTRALKINPDHAEALVQVGGVQTMLGPVLQKPDWVTRGIGQMNRAVELAPTSTRVRLQRAFLGLNLPENLRNPVAEAEDLDFLIEVSEWGTAGDYIRILRADLHAEGGQMEQARALYRSVEGSGSSASPDARGRLAALDQGGVPRETIIGLRAAAGAQCAMCHGK